MPLPFWRPYFMRFNTLYDVTIIDTFRGFLDGAFQYFKCLTTDAWRWACWPFSDLPSALAVMFPLVRPLAVFAQRIPAYWIVVTHYDGLSATIHYVLLRKRSENTNRGTFLILWVEISRSIDDQWIRCGCKPAVNQTTMSGQTAVAVWRH